MFAMIALCDKNGTIASNGKQPYFLKSDMSRFRTLTLDHTIIMGRSTYDQIGILPDRTNVILTHHDLDIDGLCVKSVDDILAMHHLLITKDPGMIIYVIGGGSVYQQLLPYTKAVMITRTIDDEWPNPTAKFPELNAPEWAMCQTCPEQDQYDTVNEDGSVLTTLVTVVFQLYVNNTLKDDDELGGGEYDWSSLI